MAGEGAQPAAEDDPARPDPKNGAFADPLQREVQELAVNMERLRGEWNIHLSEAASISDRFKRYVAERQIVSLTLFAIMMGIIVSIGIGLATLIWSPSSSPPPAEYVAPIEQTVSVSDSATSSVEPEPPNHEAEARD